MRVRSYQSRSLSLGPETLLRRTGVGAKWVKLQQVRVSYLEELDHGDYEDVLA